MAKDNLGVEIQASLDKNQSRNNIFNDIKSLEKTPFYIRLIAKLYKSLSKANIDNDIKTLEKSASSIRLNGRLNRATTRQNIRNDVNRLGNSANVTLGAQIDRNELQQSIETARNDVEQNLHNNPINVPVNINGNINNGAQQVQNLNNQMRNSERFLGSYITARDIFRIIANSVRKVVDEIEDLNKAQTDLQIATSKSANEMKSLMQDYNQLAKDMSSTTLDVTGAADDYLRQGQSIADTNVLIKDSLILSKIGQIESGQATEYLTSAMKGYKTEAKDVISIVDKLSAVDLESASNSGELAEAMSKTANVARSAGVELDTLIAYLATAKDITQDDASIIGNSFRSIFTRLNNIKIGKFLDEEGNDIRGEINDAERVLSKFNISLRDNAKEFRNAQDIIADVANAWETMSSVEQAAVRKAFANTYQAEKFTAIIENYNKVLQLTEVSQNSAGTAMEKFSIYENSLEAATNRLTASLEGLAYNTIDSNFLKGLANATAGIVEFVDSTKLLKTGLTAGLFTGAVAGLIALGTRMIAVRNNVMQFTQAMNLSRSATNLTENQVAQLTGYVNGLSQAQLRCVISSRQLTNEQRMSILMANGLSQAEAQAQLQAWNLVNATNAQTVATFSLRGAWEGVKASIASNPIGLIVTALTMATSAIVTYNQKQEETRRLAIETAEKNDEQAKSLDDLKQKYIEICDSIDDESTKTQNLNEFKQELVDIYGFEKEAIEKVNLEREKGIALLDEEFTKQNRINRNDWLEKNKKAINKANIMIGESFSGNNVYKVSNDDSIADSVLKLFDYNEIAGGFTTLSYQFDDVPDSLERIKNIYNELLEIQSKRTLTNDENELLDTIKSDLDYLQGLYDKYYEIYSTAAKYNAQNIVENYLNTDKGKIENVGKDTFKAWSDGLLSQAENAEQKRNLQNYIEDIFPDLTAYFNNLDLAKSMFNIGDVNSQYESQRKMFIDSLSETDLEIVVNHIPDLFADGLEGATAKIEAWKADPKNKITPDVEVDDTEISAMLETVSKKVKLITTAMEEQADTGYISSSTYADIIEMGGNFADCLEVQNGKLKLNVEKLKDLEKQELRNELAEIRLSKASWETVKATKAMGGEDTSAVDTKLRELTKQEAVINQAISEITNAKPNESGGSGKEEKPDSVVKFEEEYARRQHEINMGRMKEDEDYYKWLESAAKTAFEGLEDYQDDLWKYEEEVYKGRKQLLEDYYDTQQKYLEDRIDSLEAQVQVTLNTSTTSDGTELSTKEKYEYIKDTYQEIINEIETFKNEIINNGIEGREELVAELEKQVEEYQQKIEDTFKTAVEEEKDYIEKLKDNYSDSYDERIDKIKEQKEAAEEAIQSEIDALKKVNEEKQRTNDLEKAKQKLENAKKQRTRAVLGADGTMTYQVDQDKIGEAQQEYDEAMLENQIAILEEQKEIQSNGYNTLIENLENEQEAGERRFDILLKVLDEYLNPDNTTSNSDVWSQLAKMQGAKYENGTWYDKDGKTIDVENLVKSAEAKTDDKKKAENDNSKSETDSALKKFLTNMEKQFNLDAGSLTLEKVQQAFDNSISAHYNPYGAMKERMNTAYNNEYVNNVNNNGASSVTIGDININNPVGNSNDLAQELVNNLPNAVQRQIHKS